MVHLGRVLPVTVAAASLALALTAPAASAQQPRPMTIVDLIEIPSIREPQLSPDGRQLLYVRSDADWEKNRTVSHIWRVGADGSGAVRLTNGPDGERSPRWSPDGRTIAFLADRGEPDGTEIWLIPNGGGEARALTARETSPSSIQWSPDGRWLYFLAEDPKSEEQKAREKARDDVYAFEEDYRQRHLWRVDVVTGREERITGGDFSVLEYRLSRDGSRIAFERGPTPLMDDLREREVWVMDAAGGGMRQVTDNDVPEYGPELSPDNRRILFRSDANEAFESYYNDKIFVVSAQGGRAHVLLPALPYEIREATWSADGDRVYFTANTGVRLELFRADADGGDLEQLTRGDHAVGSWSYAPSLERHVFTIETPTDPGDVWTLDADGGEPERITTLFADITKRFRLPRQEVVRWKGEDGVEVEGLLFYPLDYREGTRYPLVVQTHGGPAASDKFGFPSSSSYEAVLTAMGYFVFKPNYRGSTGYGDDFLRDMVGGYFRQAHKDVMTGVDHLIALGLVDGERMAKMGWSGGGHMTNKIITYTDRFKAASSGAGAVNWVSMYAQSDVRYYRTPWFGGTPWQKNAPIDVYWEHSPLKDIANVTTPTIVLVGENDVRVPMAQSVELYRALKSNGVPTHLYVAPREPHGWRELRHRLFKANVELEWFERWVRGREYVWERAPEPAASEAVAAGGR
ncbi:MAG TPA: S9 family peptidase [Longimicrobiales bacterium]